MEWDTIAMTIRMTAKKNTDLKKTVKKWIRWAEGGATVRVREIAGLIGKLSATRAQHECASLYLAKLNRLKCQAVGADGWEVRTGLTHTLLPELHWWLRTLRSNMPNDMRPFHPPADIWTDASESGWGGWLQLHDQQDLGL
jgi:hypothetical protein